jgi:hypothetical protein
MERKAEPISQLPEQQVSRREGTVTDKQPWVRPKLDFVKPKLTSHGKLEDITGAFFGFFTPHP